MTEGTRSILFGCHSIVHSFYVIRAWKILYGKWPEAWQAACILWHDIGHFGLDYLSNAEPKRRHWILGARIAGVLFGGKAYNLVAGHTSGSGFPISRLKRPDKLAQLLTPERWMKWYYWVEGFHGLPPKEWKEHIRDEIQQGNWRDCHDSYMECRYERPNRGSSENCKE